MCSIEALRRWVPRVSKILWERSEINVLTPGPGSVDDTNLVGYPNTQPLTSLSKSYKPQPNEIMAWHLQGTET